MVALKEILTHLQRPTFEHIIDYISGWMGFSSHRFLSSL